MKAASELFANWDEEEARATNKQFTVRLPIKMAARVAALSEMYPMKTRTDVIGSVLFVGMSEVELELSRQGSGADGKTGGSLKQFHDLAQKYEREFEEEAGIRRFPPLPHNALLPKPKQKSSRRKQR